MYTVRPWSYSPALVPIHYIVVDSEGKCICTVEKETDAILIAKLLTENEKDKD